jgi:subtilisin family serine protease
MRNRLAAVTVVAGLALTPAVAAASDRSAAAAADQQPVVAGEYIVVLKPDTKHVNAVSRAMTAKHDGELEDTYTSALKGFTAELPTSELKALERNPAVQSIEPNRVISIADVQTPATWGLDRIDQASLPLNNSYDDRNQGTGVHAYVIDTGIRRAHNEFAGRMGNGFDAVTPGGTAEDCNGHGTHVAGTVGGSTYGVADQVTLHPVRVLGCTGSGTTAGVIAGVDWVRSNAVKPAVANMSLGGGISSALDNAVSNAVNSGITFAVAAGNENTNACNSSPARTPNAITVGATTNTDARSSFSNFGTCLDVFAPGSNITAAWHTSNSAANTISGTSMASPHVAGVAAIYLSANPAATPAAVANAIVTGATANKVTSPGTGSPNRLLQNSIVGGTTPPPPPPPPPPPAGVIANGGFESGITPWTQSSPYQVISNSKPRTGSYSVWLGGYNNANDKISQAVTVPANGTLRYYWQQTSTEGTSTAYDYMHVRVYATSGTLLGTLRTWSNRNVRNVWSQDAISLAAYAGQTVRVSFDMTADSSLISSFYVDDVTL